MIIVAFVLGFLLSYISLWFGFYFSRYVHFDPSTKGTDSKLSFLPPLASKANKNQRRTPKYVSEEEQWLREQKQAPLDPLYRP